METTDPLFEAGALRVHALQASDIPRLQAFFDANPGYFLLSGGAPPRPDEAQRDFDDRPPPGMSYSRTMTLGFDDVAGQLQAMANVVADLMAEGTWHIGLFIVATRHHGSGLGRLCYEGLERWIRRQPGAAWLRLGVIAGNTRAERFWARQGYTELRQRAGQVYGPLTHTVRVMAKPLAGRGLDEYLALVPRDRPER